MRYPQPMTDLLPHPRRPDGLGRPPRLIDLDKVRELAACHLPETAIAAACGISHTVWTDRKRAFPQIEQAISEGRATASALVAEAVQSKLRAGDPIVTIFTAKQTPERGGLGWMDERSIKVSGSIALELPQLDAWRRAQADVVQQADVIDLLPE